MPHAVVWSKRLSFPERNWAMGIAEEEPRQKITKYVQLKLLVQVNTRTRLSLLKRMVIGHWSMAYEKKDPDSGVDRTTTVL